MPGCCDDPACDDSLTFPCEYCHSTDLNCLRLNPLTGECAEFADGGTPNHCPGLADPSDGCRPPHVSFMPFDGYASGTWDESRVCPVDLDHNDLDDLYDCTGVCQDNLDSDLAACEAAYPECVSDPGCLDDGCCADYCGCVVAASGAYTGCAEDCKIGLVPAWLDCVQATLTHRRGCCRGAYSKCLGKPEDDDGGHKGCEQAYFDAMKDNEADWFTDFKTRLLAYYDTLGCAHATRTNTPQGFVAVPDYWRLYEIDCAYSSREGIKADAQKTRAECWADCERDAMIVRKICDAGEHHCDGDCDAAYFKTADDCLAAYYDCSCADPTADCSTAAAICQSAAVEDGVHCRVNCCEVRHLGAVNGNQRADCLATAWITEAKALVECCYGYNDCVAACTGPDAEVAACVAACVADHSDCIDGLSAAYETAVHTCKNSYPGDCPNCFDDTAEPHTGTPPICSIERYQLTGCEPPELIDGVWKCIDVVDADLTKNCDGSACPEHDPDDWGNCSPCGALTYDEHHFHVNCNGYSCDFYDDDRHGTEDNPCPPAAFVHPALGCVVDIRPPGTYLGPSG